MKQPDRSRYTSTEELRYETHSDTDFSRAHFDGTMLTHVTLLDCNVAGGHFRVRAYRSRFPRTSFVGADLHAAIFHRCDFRNASLRDANLAHASFDGTSFVGADLTGADLTGTNLQRADDLVPRQVIAARNWELAHLDPQLRRECELLTRVGVPVGPAASPEHDATATNSSWADRIFASFEQLETRRRPTSPATPAAAARATKAYSEIVRAPATKPRLDRSPDGELIDLTREL